MAQLKSTNVTGNLSVTGNILASKIIKFGGTEEQILLANGDVITKSALGGQITNNTTYTFESGTNCFYVTPSGGEQQTVSVTPSITNNITGSGTSGYIAKFNGTNSITSGPAFGTDTTKFLNSKGEWAVPPNNFMGLYTVAEQNADLDLNNLTTAGSYRINSATNSKNLPTFSTSGVTLAYGQLLVVRGASDTIAQLAFPYGVSEIAFRTGNPVNNTTGTWKDWKLVATQDWVTNQLGPSGSFDLSNYATKDDIAKYLPLAGNTNDTLMTGTIKYGGVTCEIISFAPADSTWRGGLKYSWSSNTTIGLWGKHKNSQFVWHAGTDFSGTDVNGTTVRTYDFQVGRDARTGGSGQLEALLGGKPLATQEWVTTQFSSGGSMDLNNYLPLSGGEMSGPITYPVASGGSKPKNYISAGGGYSASSGKEGLKILALEQSDATMGLGVDLTGGPYELTVATSRIRDTQASKIVFATHTVGGTAYKTLAKLTASGAADPAVTLTVPGTAQANGFEHMSLTVASGKSKDDYVLLAGGGTKEVGAVVGTDVSVTVEDAKATRYLTFVKDHATKTQPLTVDDDIYYTSDSNYNQSSFNVGKSTGNGILTLHRYTKGSTDHFIDLAVKNVLSDDYKVYLPPEKEATLATQEWVNTKVPTVSNKTITIATSGDGLGLSSDNTFTLNQSSDDTITLKLDSAMAGNRDAKQVVIAAEEGQINSEKYAITNDGGTVKATWQYNSSTDCVELMWA